MDKSFTPEMITPQWVALLLLASLVLFFGPRKYVLPTMLVATAFLALQNRIYILNFNFFTARILLLVAWVRVLSRGEHRGLEIRPMDKALMMFSFWSIISETLLRGFPGTIYAVANHLYDALGTYFLARIYLSDVEVFRQLIKTFCVICCILSVFMMVESLTSHNLLACLGAASAVVQERAGRLRCQATFQHPVLAGTYGATLLPLFAACWWQPRLKTLAVPGCIAAIIMILTAGSGGPLMTLAAVLVGLFVWPLRHQMRLIRWGIVLMLVALQMVMNAPVWALIARLQVVPGASSYHRYVVIDAFVTHVSDWWFDGVLETGSWGWLTDDVANYFCVVCKHAGLLGLILLIRVLVVGFRETGIRRQEAEEIDRPTEILVWAFGISLFAHVVSFWGTSYFDQTIVLWHFTLAMLASLYLLTQDHKMNVAMTEDTETSDGAQLQQALPAN
jgi:hypothetical protein